MKTALSMPGARQVGFGQATGQGLEGFQIAPAR